MRRTRDLTLHAVMISLALALSGFERLIPLQMVIPLPGVKLGLANIVSLVALYLWGAKSAFVVLLVRCLLANAFGGGAVALLFSMVGGVFSMLVMVMARRLPCLSIYGVSILGAAAHNTGQILVAMAVMNSVYAGAYLSYLLLISIVTGVAVGVSASGVLRAIRRM